MNSNQIMGRSCSDSSQPPHQQPQPQPPHDPSRSTSVPCSTGSAAESATEQASTSTSLHPPSPSAESATTLPSSSPSALSSPSLSSAENPSPSAPPSLSTSPSTPSAKEPLPSHPNNVYSRENLHPLWSPEFMDDFDEECEFIGRYKTGGFHPVLLGDIIDDKYTVVHKLGYGGYATIWMAWDRVDHCYVTLKIACADQSTGELEMYQYLEQFDYANHFICPLLRHFTISGPHGDHICLVFPVAGTKVATRCRNSATHTNLEDAAATRHFGRQLADAVAFLHSVGIVHGDITSNNVLTALAPLPDYSFDELYSIIGEPDRLQPHRQSEPHPACEYLVSPAYEFEKLPTVNRIMLIDFGESSFIHTPPAKRLNTPWAYLAPESVLFPVRSPASDIWAVGCLLYMWYSYTKLFDEGILHQGVPEWTKILGELPSSYTPQINCLLKEAHAKYPWIPETVDLLEFEDLRKPSTGPRTLREYIHQSWVWEHPDAKKTMSIEDISQQISASFPDDPPRVSCSVTVNNDRSSMSFVMKPLQGAAAPPPSTSETTVPTSSPALLNDTTKRLFHHEDTDSVVALDPRISEFANLLKQLLSYQPEKRLPALLMLQHPWFSNTPTFELCDSIGPVNNTTKDKLSDTVRPIGDWVPVLDVKTLTWSYKLSADV